MDYVCMNGWIICMDYRFKKVKAGICKWFQCKTSRFLVFLGFFVFFQSYSFVIQFIGFFICLLNLSFHQCSHYIIQFLHLVCVSSTLTSKQLSTKRCSNIIVLLRKVETERVQAWWEHWLSLLRRSRTPVASRTKFFVATVNGWESLFVDSKISILVTLGVPDSPLYEIKMSKLNKQHISQTEYY